MNPLGDILRQRHRFVCLLPRVDRGGLWVSVTWAFWTWDYLPPRVAHEVALITKTLREGK